MPNELPTLPVSLPARRWRAVLRSLGVRSKTLRLLSRCRQGKPASWLDLDLREFATLMHVGVLPPMELSLVPKGESDGVEW